MGQQNSEATKIDGPGENGTTYCALGNKEVVVETKFGKIAGKEMRFEDCKGKVASAFLGIPFARPPIGPLRFKKPEPPEPWKGIRQTKNFPPECPQGGIRIAKTIFGQQANEDCLCLNVFSPKMDPNIPKLFPVIVFIHGGAFVIGNSKLYDDKGICKHFVIKNEIVFLTIQYRVGPLGFFSTGDDACDDNAGLWDMTMALKWVQRNIGAFGGDPQNVTLMGVSAGGMAADLLALSPHSRDLFHKLIPMSGNSECDSSLHDNAIDKCRQIAYELGIFTLDSKERIEQLQKLPVEKLHLKIFDGDPTFGKFKCPLSPRIDGKFFPKSLEELRKEAKPKPKLMGGCQLEALLFMIMLRRKGEYSKIFEFIARIFPEEKCPKTFNRLRREALKMYFPEENKIGEYCADQMAVEMATAQILSDFFMGIAIQKQILEHLENEDNSGAPIYLYTMEHCNPRMMAIFEFIFRKRFPFKVCTHGCDLFYFFKNVDFKFFGRKMMNAEDEKMVEICVKIWSNFAKFDNPNGSEIEPNSLVKDFEWEPVSKEQPSKYLALKPNPEMKDNFQEGRPMRWIELLKN